MSTFSGPEAIANALVARLISDLPGQIDTINSQVTDGYTIDYMGDDRVLDFIPGPGELSAGVPVIGIEDGIGRIEDDIGFAATGVYGFSVYTFDQDPEKVALARKLRRWQRALASALMRDRRLSDGSGAVGWGITLARWLPGDTLGVEDPDRGKTWLSWAGVEVVCKSDE